MTTGAVDKTLYEGGLTQRASHKSNGDYDPNIETPLTWATRTDTVHSVRALLADPKADPNIIPARGISALHTAAYNGRIDTEVRAPTHFFSPDLSRSSSIPLKSALEKQDNTLTALDVAVLNRDDSCVVALLDASARVSELTTALLEDYGALGPRRESMTPPVFLDTELSKRIRTLTHSSESSTCKVFLLRMLGVAALTGMLIYIRISGQNSQFGSNSTK